MITTIEGANLTHLRSKDRGCGNRAQEADLASEPGSHSWAHTRMVWRPERGRGGAGGEQAWGAWSWPWGWKGRPQQEVRGQEASALIL